MRVAVPLEQCWHPVPGGTAATAIALTSALDERPDVDVVGVSARHAAPPAPPWEPTVPVRPLPLPRRVLYETWHALAWPRVESVTGAVDICHAVGGAVPATRAPLVFTIHDLAFLHHPDLFTRHGLRFFRRALDLVRDRAAEVHVPSLATLEDCVTAGIDRERLRHVPWGVEVSEPSAEAIAEVRRRYGLGDRYVLCVGTLEPRKNLGRLLQAWEMVPRDGAQLVVVGPDGWGDVGRGSSPPSDVVFTGFVPTATRDALYAGAAVSVYPSLFEGFGLPVLESMALGCPVITSRGTSTEELVAGGAGVAIEPTDVEAIAGAVTDVLGDDALRARLAVSGRDRAAEHRWDVAASLTVRGYEAVLA